MKPQTHAAVHASDLVIDLQADTPQRFLDERFDLAGKTIARLPG